MLRFQPQACVGAIVPPAGSGLNGPQEPVRFRLRESDMEMEIVTGLDRWLRAQLVRYDTAEGFGVFAVMNAVRPDIPRTAVTSPDLCSWAWQQVLREDAGADAEVLTGAMRRLYAIMRDAEKMILEKFPPPPLSAAAGACRGQRGLAP